MRARRTSAWWRGFGSGLFAWHGDDAVACRVATTGSALRTAVGLQGLRTACAQNYALKHRLKYLTVCIPNPAQAAAPRGAIPPGTAYGRTIIVSTHSTWRTSAASCSILYHTYVRLTSKPYTLYHAPQGTVCWCWCWCWCVLCVLCVVLLLVPGERELLCATTTTNVAGRAWK